MARPSKLSEAQCDRIRMLKAEGVSAPQLAKRFKISESSLYKILNGSYVAAADGKAGTQLEQVGDPANQGATPSLFKGARASATPELDVSRRVIAGAESASRGLPIDEATLAAAELIVAQAKYLRASKHTG